MRYFDAHFSWPKSRKKTLSVERVSELLTRPHYAGYLNAPEWDIHMVKAKHEALISFETYQRVQQRLTEKAKAPARKDINEDFPLRGFVRCECCGNYMTSCWSKGRNGKYLYYVCQTRGCDLKGKSIRKQRATSGASAVVRRPQISAKKLKTFSITRMKFAFGSGERIAGAISDCPELKREI